MAEELKPIRMDGKYQTRDGRAVRILCVDRKNTAYPVVALIAGDHGCEDYCSFTQDGYHASCKASHPCDIIEVDEQVRYANVNGVFGLGALVTSLEKANQYAINDRTGILKITHINGKLTSVEIVE